MDEKIKAFFAKIGQVSKDIWNNNKIILFIVGAIALIIKFRSLFVDFLVKDSKNKLEEASKKDEVLVKEESDLKEQANDLVEKAKSEGSSNSEVDENWNVKK